MLDVVVKGNYVLWVFPLVSPISPSVWTLWRDERDEHCYEDPGLEIPRTLHTLSHCPPAGCIGLVHPLSCVPQSWSAPVDCLFHQLRLII